MLSVRLVINKTFFASIFWFGQHMPVHSLSNQSSKCDVLFITAVVDTFGKHPIVLVDWNNALMSTFSRNRLQASLVLSVHGIELQAFLKDFKTSKYTFLNMVWHSLLASHCNACYFKVRLSPLLCPSLRSKVLQLLWVRNLKYLVWYDSEDLNCNGGIGQYSLVSNKAIHLPWLRNKTKSWIYEKFTIYCSVIFCMEAQSNIKIT